MGAGGPHLARQEVDLHYRIVLTVQPHELHPWGTVAGSSRLRKSSTRQDPTPRPARWAHAARSVNTQQQRRAAGGGWGAGGCLGWGGDSTGPVT